MIGLLRNVPLQNEAPLFRNGTMQTETCCAKACTVRVPAKGSRRAIYFSWTSVAEDGTYVDAEKRFINRFVKFSRRSSSIGKMWKALSEELHVDFWAEVSGNAPTVDMPRAKIIQTFVHVALAKFAQSLLSDPIAAASGYSGGICAAYVFAGILKPRIYLNKVAPFSNSVRQAMVTGLRKGELYETLLVGKREDDVETVVERCIAGGEGTALAFIKDRRERHTTLVCGSREWLQRIFDTVAKSCPAVVGRGVAFIPAGGGHTPYLERHLNAPHIPVMTFSAPQVDVVSSQGRRILAHSQNRALLKRRLIESCVEPLNTGGALVALLSHTTSVVFIGSKRASRVFLGHSGESRVATIMSLGS